MASTPPDFSDRPQSNPYLSGQLAGAAQMGGPTSKPLPTFCTVYFIIDLIFCFLRAAIVMIAIVTIQNPEVANNPMVAQTSMFEIGAGLGMVLLGIPGNFLMLFKQRFGAYLAGAKVLPTLASFGVGLWQLTFIMGQFPEGSAERMGAMIGAGMALLVRIALLAVYIGAIVTFLNWCNRRDAGTKPSF